MTKLVKIKKAAPLDWYFGAIGQEITVVDNGGLFYSAAVDNSKKIWKSDCEDVEFSILRMITFKGYSGFHDLFGAAFWIFVLSCIIGAFLIGFNT